MSDMRVMLGYVSVLNDTLTDEQVEAFNDAQYDNGWYINSDKTLVIQDMNRNAPKDRKQQPEGFMFIGTPIEGAMIHRHQAEGLGLKLLNTQFYCEYFYDGCGARIHEVTKEDFLAGKFRP